uniref:G-protein coupled receptors family 1 profile domain-containing protein n=1 Tax=Sinocyclocheilus anshuiensis TaxID=1608454 RepID=A0A671RNZ4_9TELE
TKMLTIMDQNATNSTEGPCGLSEMPARPFFLCLYTVIFLASLVLNSITVYVYFCKATNQSSITIYLKNLAIADLFVCLCLILRIAKYARTSIEIQRIYCNFGAPASYLNMYSSILFMGYIATHTLQTGLALLTWGVMMFFMLPNAILSNQPMPKVFSCMALKSDLGQHWHEMSAHFNVGIFWVAFLLMVFCYTSIAYHVYRSYKRVQQESSVARRRSNRSIFSLLAVFVFCFVPYHVCRVPYTLSQSHKDDFSPYNRFILFQIKEATLFLSALNVCLDPVIYFFMCRTFRESLFNIKLSPYDYITVRNISL